MRVRATLVGSLRRDHLRQGRQAGQVVADGLVHDPLEVLVVARALGVEGSGHLEGQVHRVQSLHVAVGALVAGPPPAPLDVLLGAAAHDVVMRGATVT